MAAPPDPALPPPGREIVDEITHAMTFHCTSFFNDTFAHLEARPPN